MRHKSVSSSLKPSSTSASVSLPQANVVTKAKPTNQIDNEKTKKTKEKIEEKKKENKEKQIKNTNQERKRKKH
jgi:hypothetical protein